MKTHLPETLQAPGGPVRKDRRGVALITVLTFVALTTILMMTFFFMAQNEHMASVNYSEGLQAQEVAESAVNLVIAQIREATSQRNHLWAAQPGAIRLWDDSGKFVKGYKLYSDDRMVSTVSERDFSREDFAEMSTWTAQPWAYVDLNEPVIRGSKVFYPIVDPEAADLPKWPALIGGTGRKGDDAGVEGFDYDRNHDRVRLSDFDKEVQSLTGKDVLPMPAKWIYQLKDGSLGYLNTGNKYVSLSSGGSVPSESNPMVARFAFWADDESAKLNINTHAGGASWNTPLTGGDVDRNYGAKQPLKGEFQRYNGHPASTHLSPALMPGVADITNDRQALEMMFDITPRVVGGGSLFGTKAIDPTGGVDRSLKPDHDRLYATIDELLFKDFSATTGMRELNAFPKGGGRVGTATTLPDKEALELLERMRFFLTTNSRAPETNVFNMPRVSIWPTFDRRGANEVSYLTGFDKLIRFCSEMGVDTGDTRHAYYFTRRNSDSARDDFNEIKRNREVFAYLDYLTSERVPGYGGDFASKYDGGPTGNRIQLLTQIFDYIRSTNLSDDSLYLSGTFEQSFRPINTTETVQYTNPRLKGKDGGLHPGFGQVTPIQIDWTDRKYGNNVEAQGFGRFFTLSEVGVAVITCAQSETESGDEDPKKDNGRVTHRYPGGRYGGFSDPGAFDPISHVFTDFPIPPTIDDHGKKTYFSNFPPLPLNVVLYVRKIGEREVRGKTEPIMGFTKPGDPATAPLAEAADVNNYNWPPWIFDLLTRYGTKSGTEDDWGTDEYPFTDEMFNKHTVPKPPEGPEGDEHWIVAPKELLWAFDEKNWNWMLAWLDDNYRNGMQSDPDGTIYKRGSISTDLIAAENMRLKEGETLCQAALLFQMAGVSPGNVSISPDFQVTIELESGLTFPGGGTFIGPGGGRVFELFNAGHIGGSIGDGLGYGHFLTRPGTDAKGGPPNLAADQFDVSVGNGLFLMDGTGTNAPNHTTKRRAWFDTGYHNEKTRACDKYDLVTAPFKINSPAGNLAATQQRMKMTRGVLNFKVYTAGNDEWPQGDERNKNGNYNSAPQSPKQLVQEVQLEIPDSEFQVPKLDRGHPGLKLQGETKRQRVGAPAPLRWSISFDGANPHIARVGRMAQESPFYNWDEDKDYANTMLRGVGLSHGDARIAAAKRLITTGMGLFATAPGYEVPEENLAFIGLEDGSRERMLVDKAQYSHNHPKINYKYKSKDVQLYGDFDSGPGIVRDGPYINKPDEGNLHYVFTAPGGSDGGIPYFSATGVSDAGTPSYFSPNRIVCSPVMFGSLPSRPFSGGPDSSGTPWQTLLFRPKVNGGIYSLHPGTANPPDHLLLDLFWMPVVEPYAISEPLSTAGKVNLNYQILPYLNVKRNTALRGVFKSEYMVVIPIAWESGFKEGASYGAGWHPLRNPYGGSLTGISLRAHIEPTGTFEQMDKKFEDGTIYKTASEVCDIHLVPISIGASQGGGRDNGINTPHYNQMANGTYWSVNRVTGDNAKERPYNNIYPRVTTKSNVYKVHYRAQIIRKAGPSPVDSFDPELDQVVAEYRGSSTVERYVEPNDPDIPDYTQIVDDPALPPLDEFYRFRVLNPTRFAP